MTEQLPTKERVYVIAGGMGDCKMCGRRQDLRFGACWDCSVHVGGESLGNGNHRVWDTRNPRNEWFVSERGH